MEMTRESSPLASLELLNTFGCRLKRLRVEQGNNISYNAISGPSRKELSTVDIIKVAMDKFLGSTSQSCGDPCMLVHSGYSCRSSDIDNEVEPVLFLLASAEKVANEQFDRARKLLSMCNHLASCTGSPVQRLVYYFAQALDERIERKIGMVSSEGRDDCKRWLLSLEEATISLQPPLVAFGLAVPSCLVYKSAGIQSILDAMVSATRIHLIDLGLRNGMHWPFLMQALAVRHECPIESLTITALVTSSEKMIKDTGKRLSQFASTLGLPFSFKTALVHDINDLKEDCFEIETGERIGVYSSMLLRNVVGQLGQFETLMRVIKSLRPTVMVMIEQEADTTSSDFMDRFIGGLVHYSALFDAVEFCLSDSNPQRMPMEGNYFCPGIRQIITFDIEERASWDLKIKDWRTLLNSFNIVEKDLSSSSLYQANLVIKNSAYSSLCTLSMDGKSLLSGWRGAPLYSLSAWEFLP
ncbi:GRAS family transcription factor [Heracleum sosnowskyi]|uniref:GRAS family transcription factor n=1 Tax=Heracleum sosnowskyi TaxID=360622 RepID=A0AAD8GNG7_9APIA|nr:GRAS family transcription factor [Heracleum sosnowskyi]